MCKNNSIRSANQRSYILQPLLRIRLDPLHACIPDPDMTPGMTCEFPAIILDRICHLLCLSTLVIPVKVRMCIQPCLLISGQILMSLISDIRTITQDSIITGQCDHTLRTVIRCIRMLCNKLIQKRNTVISARYGCSICLHILTGRFSIFIQHDLRSNTSSIVTVIITQIIQRHHECFFTSRKLQFRIWRKMHCTIRIRCLDHQVSQANQHISVIIHCLRDLIKLIHRSHPLLETGCNTVISRKTTIRIHDQRMIENMSHLIHVNRNTAVLRCLILSDLCRDLRVISCTLHAI